MSLLEFSSCNYCSQYTLFRKHNAYSENVWIGLYNSDGSARSDDIEVRRRAWQWVDRTRYISTGWTGWEVSEPGFSEKWVRMRGGEWLAIDREDDANYFVCQKCK